MAPEFFAEVERPTYDKSVDVFAMGLLYLTMFQAKEGKPLLQPKCGKQVDSMITFKVLPCLIFGISKILF